MSRLRNRILPVLAVPMIALFVLTMIASAASIPVPERGFVSSKPAKTWEEGLICGNGTMGVNVLSRPLDERIIFTHERLFLPMGQPLEPRDQSERLSELRQLIEKGFYREAAQFQFDLSGQKGFMYPDYFVPAFDLTIESEPDGAVRDYARSVDFETGETRVHWADDRGAFDRRMFVSRKDSVAVLMISGPAAESLNCRLALVPRESSEEFNDDGDINMRSDEVFQEHVTDVKSHATPSSLSYRNRFSKTWPGSIHALEAYSRVIVRGGEVTADAEGGMVVRGAESLLLLLDIRLLHDPAGSEMTTMKVGLERLPADYQKLLDRHAGIHGDLFGRVRLDLGGGEDHLRTTEDLLERSSYENMNRALIEKQFDAGRYNIISCTGELPPNLQGVWAGNYVPGWASDYTHNGNLASAIATNLMGNTPELMLAYTSYLESLVPWMETNAKHMFGARGIVLPSRTTTHGFNNAFAPDFAGGMWVAGAGWASHFFYDYYLYTGDLDFLAEHALPFMEKAGLFFEDYLYEGEDGCYVFSPTQSPENTPANSDSQATFNATMDVAVAKELFLNLIAASRTLGVNDDRVPAWEEMLTKMPPYMICEEGLIKEWSTPKLENNDPHRHSSQIYALYDSLPDEIAHSPELREAFRKSIAYKLKAHWQDNQVGFMSFGLVQLGQASASLGEGELAYHCLKHLVNRFWLNNLASMHNHRSLFNMDISGGMPAVIIKMLVDSAPGEIRLLPALPQVWTSGCLEGVRCRGAVVVEQIQWDGKEINVSLVADHDQTLTVALPHPILDVSADGGQVELTDTPSNTRREVFLTGGKVVSLKIRLK